MVRNNLDAAALAEQQTSNTPGTCQLWTRTMLDAPSAGDRDRDGDADAVDGWKSEPEWARHTDRNPPRGFPVAWSGGSRGYGHRAISLGNGKVRSTDVPSSGRVGTVSLDYFEKKWGLHYLGWSETITGAKIPVVVPVRTRGQKIDEALESLRDARGKGKRRRLINKAKDLLRKVKPL